MDFTETHLGSSSFTGTCAGGAGGKWAVRAWGACGERAVCGRGAGEEQAGVGWAWAGCSGRFSMTFIWALLGSFHGAMEPRALQTL